MDPVTIGLLAAGVGISAYGALDGQSRSKGSTIFSAVPLGKHGRTVEKRRLDKLRNMRDRGEDLPPALARMQLEAQQGRVDHFQYAREASARSVARTINPNDSKVLGAIDAWFDRGEANLNAEIDAAERFRRNSNRENFTTAGLSHVSQNFGASLPFVNFAAQQSRNEQMLRNQYGTTFGNAFTGLMSGLTNSYVAQQGYAGLFGGR